MTKELKFECPMCEHTVLEEVRTGVVGSLREGVEKSLKITSIDESGAIKYDSDSVSHDKDEWRHYQCESCEERLTFEPTDESGDCGYTVGCEKELVEWLKANCSQE